MLIIRWGLILQGPFSPVREPQKIRLPDSGHSFQGAELDVEINRGIVRADLGRLGVPPTLGERRSSIAHNQFGPLIFRVLTTTYGINSSAGSFARAHKGIRTFFRLGSLSRVA